MERPNKNSLKIARHLYSPSELIIEWNFIATLTIVLCGRGKVLIIFNTFVGSAYSSRVQ